ncbi:MAG: hypothetical protein Q7T44_16660 [Parvibaculum sp.]|nr:hypothetical protein [Parvibaculum sp.]
MKLKLLLAAIITLVAPLNAYAKDFEYELAQTNQKLVVAIPHGWAQVSDTVSKDGNKIRLIEFRNTDKKMSSEVDNILIGIIPPFGNQRMHPQDEQAAVAADQITQFRDQCGASWKYSRLSLDPLANVPVAHFNSSCWRKPEALVVNPKLKRFFAISFLAAYDGSKIIAVGRTWATDNDGTSSEDLLTTQAMFDHEEHEKNVADFAMTEVTICDKSVPDKACRNFASTGSPRNVEYKLPPN